MNQYIYYQNKTNDVNVEHIISDFTNEYFWKKVNAKRTKDKNLQWKGSDFSITNSSGQVKHIDEKAKTYGCLNKILQYPSFELSIRNGADFIQDGWFLKSDSLTDVYAFLAVYTTASEPSKIEFSNIQKVNMLLVKKQDVLDFVTDNVKHDAKALREYTDIQRACGKLGKSEKKAHHRYKHGRYHLTYSFNLMEQPVNLVIARNALENLPHSKQIEITPTGFKEIKEVNLQDCMM